MMERHSLLTGESVSCYRTLSLSLKTPSNYVYILLVAHSSSGTDWLFYVRMQVHGAISKVHGLCGSLH